MRTALPRLGALVATVVLPAVAAGCGGSSSSSTASGTAAVDRAFVQQMVPHHRLAVDMGNMALKQGEHPELKALAHSIVSAQNDEIALMTRAAGRLGAKVAPGGQMGHGGMSMDSPQMEADAKTLGLAMDAMGMSMQMDRLDGARPFDRAFLDMMVPHHEGAVRMARAELAKGGDGELKALAQRIIGGQTKEIGQMNGWRTGWFGAPSPAGGVPAG